MSPRLKEIFNSLIDDPDLIPPENTSKEDYALMLAEQRIRQYENNERALELGISKHIRPYTNAVDRLSSFVNLSKAPKKKKEEKPKPVKLVNLDELGEYKDDFAPYVDKFKEA